MGYHRRIKMLNPMVELIRQDPEKAYELLQNFMYMIAVEVDKDDDISFKVIDYMIIDLMRDNKEIH